MNNTAYIKKLEECHDVIASWIDKGMTINSMARRLGFKTCCSLRHYVYKFPELKEKAMENGKHRRGGVVPSKT